MATVGCGCPLDGLTRNITIWTCAACGHDQMASARRCEACNRRKPRNPRGFGCCDQTWPEGAGTCGTCGCAPDADLIAPCSDLNTELAHYAPNVERGSFVNRRGETVCVGCLAPE